MEYVGISFAPFGFGPKEPVDEFLKKDSRSVRDDGLEKTSSVASRRGMGETSSMLNYKGVNVTKDFEFING